MSDKVKEALEASVKFSYLRGIADKGVSDAQIMNAHGITQHPRTTFKEALLEASKERYRRNLR